ncbi:MAG: fibronectin type III domain-containing protein [Lachnospiraceae bacterium]|nr:fibronectin type III domain-containing protein [Lachnospiraceae bacterium]
MKNLVKFSKAWMLALLCVLFLGVGIKAEAAPGTVTGLKQTGHNTTAVQVEWKKVTDAAKYKVEYCENSSFSGNIKSGEISTNSGVIGGLTAGKSYYVRVSAIDASGNVGTASSKIEVVTCPSKVSGLKQTKAENEKISLSWNKAAGASYYRIGYVKSTSSKPTYKNVTTNSYSFKASANSQYAVAVLPARKSSTGYIASNDYTQTTMATLPGKISSVKMYASGSDTKPTANIVDFTWKRSNAAAGYEYEVYGSGKKPIVKKSVANQNSKTILVREKSKKLKNGQFMKIRVRGYVKIGRTKKYGKWSDYTYFAKYPTGIKKSMVGNRASDGVKISWKKVSGATNYTVYVTKNPRSTKWSKVTTTKKTNCVIKKCGKSALTTYTNYYYRIVANKKVKKTTYKSDTDWYNSFRIVTSYY